MRDGRWEEFKERYREEEKSSECSRRRVGATANCLRSLAEHRTPSHPTEFARRGAVLVSVSWQRTQTSWTILVLSGCLSKCRPCRVLRTARRWDITC